MSDLISKNQSLVEWKEDFKGFVECLDIPRDDYNGIMAYIDEVPSAESERLTDDDFETIRIHLNAYKEKLCNQQRWEEAEEYQRIIDRFMAFASAEPEIIRCRDCKYSQMTDDDECRFCKIWFAEEEHFLPGDYYCADAERKEE